MNTLIFIAGMGAGTVAGVTLTLLLIRTAFKTNVSEAKKTNQEQTALMKERNEIDIRMANALERLADTQEEGSK